MKRFLRLFILVFVVAMSAGLFCGCEADYPDSALYVGQNQKYTTIQSAIDASDKSGQFIVVKNGVYKENIYIPKAVKIMGYGNSVTLNGSATIASDGVYFEKIAFSGKDVDVENAIIVTSSKDVTGLNLFRCSIKSYKGCGLISMANPSSPTKFNALTLQNVSFVNNGVAGMKLNNIKSFVVENCVFEKNGTTAGEEVGSAIQLDLLAGKYSSVEVHSTDFKLNGNKNPRGGAFVCSHTSNSFDGEIVFDNCLFQGNSYDVISGKYAEQNSAIDICVINSQGLKTNVKKLGED